MCGGGGDKGMGQTIREAAIQVATPPPAAAPAEDPKKKVRGYATRGNILTSGQGLTQAQPNTKKNLLGG